MDALIYKLILIIKVAFFILFYLFTLGKYNWQTFNSWWEKHDTDVLTTITGSTLGIVDGVEKSTRSNIITTNDVHDVAMVVIKAIVGGVFAFITGNVIKYLNEKYKK